MTKKITVIGAGAFGFAIAKHISDKLADKNEIHKGSSYDESKSVFLFDIDEKLIKHISTYKSHKYFFPEIRLNELVISTSDVKLALKDSDLIILSIPTRVLREFLRKNSKFIKDNSVLVNCSKGMEIKTKKLISEIVSDTIKKKYKYAVLSGGMVASEFISGFGIFGADLACNNNKLGTDLQRFLSTRKLKVYLTDDIRGIELAGALKNVISIASGFMDGINFPFGSKTLIVSLAAQEIKCISRIMNSKSHTYNLQTQAFGNDYIMSTLGNSRNRYLGELIGKGMTPKHALTQMEKEKKTAEGYYTAKVAYQVSKSNNLNTPIINMVYDVLYNNKNIEKCISQLMDSTLEITPDCKYKNIC